MHRLSGLCLQLRLRSVFVFFFFCVFLNAAQARVGGGEHFDSGRTGEGGGATELIFYVLYFLLKLIIYEPRVGISLLLILLVAGAAYGIYRKKHAGTRERKRLDEMAAQRNTRVDKASTQAWIAALKKEDPEFQISRLFEYSRQIFHHIQSAWFQRDLQAVRPFLSDAVFQRLRIQLRLMQQQGIRDAIADWEVLTLQLVGLEKTPVFDVVHIRIDARIRDTDVPWESSDAHAQEQARKAPLEMFSEVWSLLRRPGVKTQLGWDWVQGFCPNCGAPFSGGASNQCEHCKAIVNSGNYDWVLAEICQTSEYLPHNLAAERIVEKMRPKDAQLSVQVLENKASLCFWRCIEAISFGNTSPLLKISTAEFRQHFEQQIKAFEKKPLRHCAVGSIELLGLTQNPADGIDLLGFQVRWSAHAQPLLWHFELARSSAAKTPVPLGLATFRCPHCHAPLSDSASTKCDYCDALLEAGEADWVLFQAGPMHASTQRTSIQNSTCETRVPENVDHATLLYLLALLAAADGKVAPGELQLLKSLSGRWNVPFSRVELALRIRNPSLFEKMLPPKCEESAQYLRQMVLLIQSDGHIHPAEMKLLARAAKHWGLESLLKTLLP